LQNLLTRELFILCSYSIVVHFIFTVTILSPYLPYIIEFKTPTNISRIKILGKMLKIKKLCKYKPHPINAIRNDYGSHIFSLSLGFGEFLIFIFKWFLEIFLKIFSLLIDFWEFSRKFPRL